MTFPQGARVGGVVVLSPGTPAEPPPLTLPALVFEGTQQVAAVSSVSAATPFQNVPPAASQTPVIAATPVPTITANITSVPVPPAAAPPPPTTAIVPVVPPTPPVVKVGGPEAGSGCLALVGGRGTAGQGAEVLS